MSVNRVDIVVVGGGPAGALAAWLLAGSRPEAQVVVVERQPHPAAKPCGEFLAPPGCAVLARAGLLMPLLALGKPIERLLLAAPGGSITSCMGGPSLGIRRERLDAMLLAKATERCDVRMGVRVVGVARERNGWQLRLRSATGLEHLAAGLLIGADGRHSGIRRLTGLGTMAITGRHGLSVRAAGVIHEVGRGEMHLGPYGQVGLCPVGNGEVNLNLLLGRSAGQLLRSHSPAALVIAALAATRTLASRARQVRLLTPVLAAAHLRQTARFAARPGVALIGDAAFSGDPFTGDGMSHALADAELLAHELACWAPPADPTRFLAAYALSHGRVRRRDRVEQGILSGLLDRPRWWLHGLLAAGYGMPGVQQFMANRYAV